MTMISRSETVTTSAGAHTALYFDAVGENALGVAVLLHGFSSSSKNKTNMALLPQLLAQNVAVLRIDFYGHGNSSGDIADVTISKGVDDVSSCLGYITGQVPGFAELPIAVFGSSFGGAVAIASSETNSFCGFTLKSPALDIPAMLTREKGHAYMLEWQRSGYGTIESSKGDLSINYSYVSDAEKYDLFSIAERINAPMTIIHGTRDETVPIEQSKRLAERVGELCRLIEVPSADHKYTAEKDFEFMISECAKSLIRHLTTGRENGE